MSSLKREARIAGALYLVMAAIAVVSLGNVPSWVMTGGDAAATADRITAAPMLYRLGILSDLAAQILFVFLVLSLSRLLEGVNKRLAELMVALVLVQVPMAFANMLLSMAPLVLLSGDQYLTVFDQPQLDALATGCLNLRGHGVRAVMALWGLWLVPFGLLVFRSGFLPRILGVILVAGCAGYLAVSVISLLVPAWASAVFPLTGLAVGEVLIILWLLIRGVRKETPEAHTA